MIVKMLKVLLLPMARARAFRRDDRAQVMVLTCVMVFVATIFAVQMLSTSKMVYNRIQAQNAADAAADAFALWQARAINTMQAINDLHYDINTVAYWIAAPTCVARLGCILLNFIPFVGPGLYVGCCGVTVLLVTSAELLQAIGETFCLSLQFFLKYTFSAFGFVRANTVAQANGADPVLGASLATLQGMTRQAGIPINLNGIIRILNLIPGLRGIYTIPLGTDAYPISVYPKFPTPEHIPWYFPEWAGDICAHALCPSLLRVPCSGNNSKQPVPGGLAGLPVEIKMVGDAIKKFIPGTGDCGWADTYYAGYPEYNTWIAGIQAKRGVRFGPFRSLAHNPWLNPGTSFSNPEKDVTYRGALHGRSRFQHIRRSPQRWENPGFLGVASSQIEGSSLMEKTPGNWQPSHPKLITVHIPGATPQDQESIYIYH